MVELDSVPELVYECHECGKMSYGMKTVTYCEQSECESEEIEVIADMLIRRAKWM